MDKKIIIFEDTEDNRTWIETNFNCEVMYFSKGYNDDPDLIIDLGGKDNMWQYDGIHPEKPLTDFDKIWNTGQVFADDPERARKKKEREFLELEITKIDDLRKHYEKELKKL